MSATDGNPLLHYPGPQAHSDGRFRGYCQCGWRGVWRANKSIAQADCDRHRLRFPHGVAFLPDLPYHGPGAR